LARAIVLTRGYRRSLARLGIKTGSPRGRRVGATVGRIADAEELPAPGDVEATIPPTHAAYVRRVRNENLWVWYMLRGSHVWAVAVTPHPPVPTD